VKYRMLVQTRDFVDVVARAREFGCPVPVGIALLPGNFSTAACAGEFCYHAATPHVRSAWQSVALYDEGHALSDRGRRGQRTPVRAKEAGPDVPSAQVPLAVFFGASILSGPAHLVTVALGMVASVFTCNPCCASPREVRFDVVVERPGGGYTCLEYQGDAYGLVALAKEVRGIWAGDGSKPLPGDIELQTRART
jgi:hypothetical protein